MSQFPNDPSVPPPGNPAPYQPEYSVSEPMRTSGVAIASLVFGVIGCIPFLPGMFAVVLGILGIRDARRPNRTGRGLAITGLVLGLLSLLSWTGVGGIILWNFAATGPDRTTARSFVQDLSNDNIKAAQTLCATGTSTRQLQATADEMKAWGPLLKFTPASFKYNMTTDTGKTIAVSGVAIFSTTTKMATTVLGRDSAGKPVIRSWKFQ